MEKNISLTSATKISTWVCRSSPSMETTITHQMISEKYQFAIYFKLATMWTILENISICTKLQFNRLLSPKKVARPKLPSMDLDTSKIPSSMIYSKLKKQSLKNLKEILKNISPYLFFIKIGSKRKEEPAFPSLHLSALNTYLNGSTWQFGVMNTKLYTKLSGNLIDLYTNLVQLY